MIMVCEYINIESIRTEQLIYIYPLRTNIFTYNMIDMNGEGQGYTNVCVCARNICISKQHTYLARVQKTALGVILFSWIVRDDRITIQLRIYASQLLPQPQPIMYVYDSISIYVPYKLGMCIQSGEEKYRYIAFRNILYPGHKNS